MTALLRKSLAKLRSKVAPMDMETVYSQIEKYLGKPANELFASFSEKALGSASIAEGNTTGAIVFRGVGIYGYIVSLFFAQRLFRNMLKGE